MNSVVQVGNGKIAKVHRRCFPSNVKVYGIVALDEEKERKKIAGDETLSSKMKIFSSVKDATTDGRKIIWDIVSDDHTHLDYVKQILSLDEKARIMVAKTPYTSGRIKSFEALLKKYPMARLVITENYADSNVVAKMKSLIKKYSIGKDFSLSIEFTKNRAKDIDAGRFLHSDIGVLGYEGGHMLTLLMQLGKIPAKIRKAEFTGLQTKKGFLKRQGSALITFEAKDGSAIDFYTSMNGKIRNNFPELGFPAEIKYGSELRYRTLTVTADGISITGEFDPVPGIERFHGRIIVNKNNRVVQRIDKIHDDTMLQTTRKQIKFLSGRSNKNPFPMSAACNYSILVEAYRKATDVNQKKIS